MASDGRITHRDDRGSQAQGAKILPLRPEATPSVDDVERLTGRSLEQVTVRLDQSQANIAAIARMTGQKPIGLNGWPVGPDDKGFACVGSVEQVSLMIDALTTFSPEKIVELRLHEQIAKDAAREAVHEEKAATAPADDYTTKALLDDHVRARKSRGKGRAEGTLRFYAGLRKKLEEHLPRLAKDITHPELLRYVETRREEGAGDRINKELVFLKAALKLAYKSDLFATDPAKVIPERDSMAEPRKRTLTADEAWSIVRKLAERSEAGRDHAACFAWAIATGAEHAAWSRAKPADLREDLRGCQVHGTKNEHRDRFAPSFLPEQLELLAYARKRAGGTRGALFRPWKDTNANRDLKLVCEALGIEPCSTHDVRRTYADWWGDAGVRDSLLDVALGHRPASVLAKHYRRGRFEPDDMLKLFAKDLAAHASERPLDAPGQVDQAPPVEAAGELRTPLKRATDSPADLRTGPIAQSVELRTFKPDGVTGPEGDEPPSRAGHELEMALAFALREATRASHWSTVAELARAIAARRGAP